MQWSRVLLSRILKNKFCLFSSVVVRTIAPWGAECQVVANYYYYYYTRCLSTGVVVTAVGKRTEMMASSRVSSRSSTRMAGGSTNCSMHAADWALKPSIMVIMCQLVHTYILLLLLQLQQPRCDLALPTIYQTIIA